MLLPLSLQDDTVWKQRFRATAIHWTQSAVLAPTRGLVASNRAGKNQLYAWDLPTGHLRPLNTTPSFARLSPDGRFIYFLADWRGNEIGHYARIPYDDENKVEPQDITPGLPTYSSLGMTFSPSGNRIGFVAVNAEGFAAYIIDVIESEAALGPPRRVHHSRRVLFGPYFTANGETAILLAMEQATPPSYSLLALNATSGEPLAKMSDGPISSPGAVVASPLRGDERVVTVSQCDDAHTLLIWNPRNGEQIRLKMPDGTSVCDWSSDGERLLLATLQRAITALYICDLPSGRITALNSPQGDHQRPYFVRVGAPHGDIISHWQNSTHPPQVIVLDDRTGESRRTILAASAVPTAQVLSSITYPSSDGQVIQGWLGLPLGRGPFPTILELHGGPWSVATDTFSPASQMWLDHGLAYLTVNYRGSISFGHEFQEKIRGNPGYWELEDMAAARRWLIAEGIAYPSQILLTGWSYGGYLTLLALGKQPELWAGGMAGTPIADWVTQYEDASPMYRAYQVGLFGAAPRQKMEQHIASSPITFAENVRAPVFIVHGRHDTRAPARPVELYASRLQALGKSVELHWFDSGHTGADAATEQTIRHHELMLRFVARASAHW